MEPLHGPVHGLPPMLNESWATKCIAIPDVGDNKWINICEAFRVQQYDFAGNYGKRIVLPTSIYPPQWDHKDALVEDISDAAFQQESICLASNRTPLLGPQTNSNIKYFYLSCENVIKFQPTKDKENAPAWLLVKVSVVVNKHLKNRGPEDTMGRKRSQSKHPMTKEEQCSFKIRIGLEEGVAWFVPF
jgi:hypothetical protein